MPQIKSPYNFVPLNREVYIPEWGKYVSMDIPFKDGEDGIIEVKIENVSPLFIRNGHINDTENNEQKNDPNSDDKFSSHVIVDGHRHYFIPGSSIKGAVRNVMEVLTFAKMDRYDNDSFGFRSFDTNKSENSEYADAMKKVREGWLRKIGDSYKIFRSSDKVIWIHHDQIDKLFPNFNHGQDHTTAEVKQKILKGDDIFYPFYPVVDNSDGIIEGVEPGKYHLVCTGYMKDKHHEYLFPIVEDEDPLSVSSETMQQFESIHRFTEYYSGKNGTNGILKSRLEEGESIPIFYRIRDGKVESMGIARMYRYPFANNVDQVRQNAQRNIDGKDLPSVIFGYAEKEKSLKGRVHFGHAFCEREIIKDSECPIISGVLAEPRPSYYPLYLSQDRYGTYINYSSKGAKIAGRKRYRIHKADSVTLLVKNENNEKVNTLFRPIPANNIFTLCIAVHNLKAIEVGALISALTFNDTGETFHNLGLAKPFGYGKCKFTINKLIGFSKNKEDYLKDFEYEMLRFCCYHLNIQLSQEESIRRLLSIASPDHEDGDIVQMTFDECEDFKKNTNYSVLREQPKSLSLHINEKEVWTQLKLAFYKPRLEEIKNLSKTSLAEFVKELDKLRDEFVRSDLPTGEIDKLKDELLNPSIPDSPVFEKAPIEEDIVYPKVECFRKLKGRCIVYSDDLKENKGIEVVHQWLTDFFKDQPKAKKQLKKYNKWQETFGGIIDEEVIKRWFEEFIQ